MFKKGSIEKWIGNKLNSRAFNSFSKEYETNLERVREVRSEIVCNSIWANYQFKPRRNDAMVEPRGSVATRYVSFQRRDLRSIRVSPNFGRAKTAIVVTTSYISDYSCAPRTNLLPILFQINT
jgi:hypothetical protein